MVISGIDDFKARLEELIHRPTRASVATGLAALIGADGPSRSDLRPRYRRAFTGPWIFQDIAGRRDLASALHVVPAWRRIRNGSGIPVSGADHDRAGRCNAWRGGGDVAWRSTGRQGFRSRSRLWLSLGADALRSACGCCGPSRGCRTKCDRTRRRSGGRSRDRANGAELQSDRAETGPWPRRAVKRKTRGAEWVSRAAGRRTHRG